jgi:hypothetical protein
MPEFPFCKAMVIVEATHNDGGPAPTQWRLRAAPTSVWDGQR